MAVQRIAITGGRVIDPAARADAQQSLYLAEGKVVALGKEPDGFQADRIIHVPGQIVCPGLIDLCARLREPGQEHKATIESETHAAARAGITTLCCPPDTDPVVDTPAVAELLKECGDRVGKARLLPIGALTKGLKGQQLSEMSALKGAGCIAVSNALAPLENTLILRRAMEYAASHDLLVIIRPEDPWLRNAGCAHEGAIASRLGLPGIPETAETVAVAQALALIEQTGVKAHFAQLSCARAVAMIAAARQNGIAVSADVAAHQLHLIEQNIDEFDALCHVIPPLRTLADQEGLRQGVASGVIAAICSDHQPHEKDAKLDVFPATEPGIAALETLLPLTLRLVDEGLLDLHRAIACLTSGPAESLGLPIGNLQPGAAADVCIFDPELRWTVGAGEWFSRGLNTPFWGETMKGRATYTLLGGRVVHELQPSG